MSQNGHFNVSSKKGAIDLRRKSEKILAYKCLDSDLQKWFLYYIDNTYHSESSFGGIVFQILNTINHIMKGIPGDISTLIDEYNISSEEVNSFIVNVKKEESWYYHCNHIQDVLFSIHTIEGEKLSDFYKKYKFFAVAFFDEQSFGNSIDDKKYECIKNYIFEDLIVFKGYVHMIYGDTVIRCAKYELSDISALFALDLWEAMYNRAINPKICEQCGDYFLAKSNKNKYCDDCSTDKARNKRRYLQRRNDEVQRLRQRIIEMMGSHGIKTGLFSQEVEYYEDIIHNRPTEFDKKNIEVPAHYNKNIQTRDDLIEWLHIQHEGLKGYKRKKVQECQDRLKEPMDLEQ